MVRGREPPGVVVAEEVAADEPLILEVEAEAPVEPMPWVVVVIWVEAEAKARTPSAVIFKEADRLRMEDMDLTLATPARG